MAEEAAKAKAAADAENAALEKEKAEAEVTAAAAAAEKAAEEAAKAEALVAAEKLAEEKAEAEAAETAATDTDQAGEKQETASVNEEGSIDAYIEEAVKNNSRIKGVVQWYNGGSGYGFIKPFRTKEEEEKLVQFLRSDRYQKETDKKTTTYSTGIFVHHSAIQAPDDTFFRKLYSMETVEYGIAFDKHGRPVAKDVMGPDGNYVKPIMKQRLQRD